MSKVRVMFGPDGGGRSRPPQAHGVLGLEGTVSCRAPHCLQPLPLVGAWSRAGGWFV
jgi:hypothetical protein